MSKIAVLGSGGWGTALSIVLASNGHDVYLWGRSEEQANEINANHTNNRYLPDIKLPEGIKAVTDLNDSLEGAEAVLLVVPTKAMREVLKKVTTLIDRPLLFMHASKGIEPGTHLRVSEIIEEEIPGSQRAGVAKTFRTKPC